MSSMFGNLRNAAYRPVSNIPGARLYKRAAGAWAASAELPLGARDLPRCIDCAAHALRQAAPDSPGGPGERVVGDSRKTTLVLAQRQQQVRDPVGGGEAGIGCPDAEGVYPAPVRPDEERTGLTHEPDAHRASFEREPGFALERALVVTEQIAEQTLGDPLRLCVGLAG
jgi:hypothetical protein